jgi:hypothetical protein
MCPPYASGRYNISCLEESVPQRKEIRDLSEAELYLLREGLAKFQNAEEKTHPKSWFQIAGIHGLPYQMWPFKDWDDIPRADEDGFGGFCTHSSILFLTWHRPYLALFEVWTKLPTQPLMLTILRQSFAGISTTLSRV